MFCYKYVYNILIDSIMFATLPLSGILEETKHVNRANTQTQAHQINAPGSKTGALVVINEQLLMLESRQLL